MLLLWITLSNSPGRLAEVWEVTGTVTVLPFCFCFGGGGASSLVRLNLTPLSVNDRNIVLRRNHGSTDREMTQHFQMAFTILALLGRGGVKNTMPSSVWESQWHRLPSDSWVVCSKKIICYLFESQTWHPVLHLEILITLLSFIPSEGQGPLPICNSYL